MHLTLIKLFLTLANALLQNARERNLIDGAIAKHILEGIEHANKAIADTRAAQFDDSVRDATKRSIPAIKYIPCEVLKPIYIPHGLDIETENAIIDYDIAYDKNCL